MGEFELIERVRARLAEAGVGSGGRVALGSGDDAAVLTATGASAISVDALVDGVHFRRESAPLASIGRKALAAALSDLAAVGAGPGEALVAIGVPEDLDEESCGEIVEGLVAGAAEWSIVLAGGDVVRSPAFFISVTVLGPLAARAVTRAGAEPGQMVAVTGELGGAAAGLLLLEKPELGREIPEAAADVLRARQLEPRPRLSEGRALAAAGAAAMIDVSDGLAGDARHLAVASEVAIVIELERLPLAPGIAALATADEIDAHDLAVAGGEDYELLVCLSPEAFEEATRAGVGLTVVGDVREGEAGVELREPDGTIRDAAGFDQLA